MRKVIRASKSAKARKAIQAATGSIEDMIDAVELRIQQLESGETLEMTTEILDDDIEECGSYQNAPINGADLDGYRYKLDDTYGAPQSGVSSKYFQDWWEVEEYLADNPEVEDRIAEGYAYIEEL